MTDLYILALAAALLAGVVTSVAVPPVARIAAALRAVDRADGRRKRHAGEIPRLGGVAIAVGLASGCALAFALEGGAWAEALPKRELFALAFGTGLVFLVGAVDDLFGVTPGKKFLVEFLAAWLLVRVGWSIEAIRIPGLGMVELGFWGGVVSLLWIVGVTNAINLLDGLDGLAGGVIAIIAASLLVFSGIQGNPGSVLLMAAIFGACLGFLRHNWEPARIYLGDSGSLTLGYLLAAISVHSSLKAQAAVAILVPVLALGLPVIDTILVMVLRFFERDGAPVARRFARMFHADRRHLHHLLGVLLSRHRRIVVLLYATVLLFCAAALYVALNQDLEIALALLGVEFLVIFAMRRFGLAREARELVAEQRGELQPKLAPWREAAEASEAAAEPSVDDTLSRASTRDRAARALATSGYRNVTRAVGGSRRRGGGAPGGVAPGRR